MLTFFGACKSDLGGDFGHTYMMESIENSLTYDMYYIKENIKKGNDLTTTTVNSICDIDKNYDPVRIDEGYRNHMIKIEKKYNTKLEQMYICGISNDQNSYLFEYGTDDKIYNSKTQMAINDYIQSDAFATYSLKSYLEELKFINLDEMNFDIKKGGVRKKINVMKLTFALKDSYFTRYAETYGKESKLKGKYMLVEFSYDRFSNLYVYDIEKLGKFELEYESYKLEVSYLGPKFSVPEWDMLEQKEKANK